MSSSHSEAPKAIDAAVSTDSLVVRLSDGRTVTVPLAWYLRLWHATPEERAHFDVVGCGTYIHWPELDEDLSVAGIVAGRRLGESPASLKRWLAARENGRVTK